MESIARPQLDKQDVAYVLSEHLRRSKSDKKTADIFIASNPRFEASNKEIKQQIRDYLRSKRNKNPYEGVLTVEDLQKIDEIRKNFSFKDHVYLENKKGNFSAKDRGVILFQAKMKMLSGQTKEEKIEMYKEAGYTDDEILGISGKKLLATAGLSTAFAWTVQAGMYTSAANADKIPALSAIADQDIKTAAACSVLAYISSYAAVTEQNLRLTKKYGASTSPTVTGLYFLGNRLVPNTIRDWTARGVPIISDSAVNGLGFAALVQGVSGEPERVMAGSLTAAALNFAIAGGCEIWMRKKDKQKSAFGLTTSKKGL